MTTSSTVEVSAEEQAVHDQNSLFQVIEELFAGSGGSHITLRSGVAVEIRAAKVKYLREITYFVQSFLGNFRSEEILQLIAITSKAQEDLVNQGEDPVRGLVNQIKTYVGGADLLLRVFDSCLDVAPKFIALFTSLSEEDFDNLDIDEGTVIAYSVFGRNYHFFSRQVLPVIRACIAQLAKVQKKPEKSAPVANT